MAELKCSRYIELDAYCGDYVPCKCPVCGGFLKWPDMNSSPECNKCGTELMVIPEKDEETGEELELGKICPISERKK